MDSQKLQQKLASKLQTACKDQSRSVKVVTTQLTIERDV